MNLLRDWRMRIACFLALACVIVSRWRTDRPLISYRIEGRDGAIQDLPEVLIGDDSRWLQLAHAHKLLGKKLDDAIAVYGKDYLIVTTLGREQPRVYYKLAGTHSWGIYGVLVLDSHLRITDVTTDPH